MTGFIMSKSSQQAPGARPDPLAQYPERYSQTDDDHQERYRRLTAAGHRVGQWKNDPSGLRAYEEAIKDNKPETEEAKHKRLAEKKLDIEHERDHGEMRPRGPEQYDESSQTEPPAGRPSPERIAELKAKSDASERRLQDTGMFGSGKGPPGLDPALTRRERQRAETLRGLKQDHPDLYAEESQTEPPTPVVQTPTTPEAASPTAPPSPPDLGASVQKVKDLSGGYLENTEEDFVNWLLTQGHSPHRIAVDIATRRKNLRGQNRTQVTPAFPTVGRFPPSSRPGQISNAIIRQRNRGVPHQFESDIGGNAANYR